MPTRVARFIDGAGLFIVQTEPNKIAILERPSFWNPTYEEWLNDTFWLKHDMNHYFPILRGGTESPMLFEFNGKTYAKLGLSESGFKRIRWIEKLHSPVHDDVDEGTGEEEDDDPAS